MTYEIPKDLIYAAFFFIDIVGLSNPVLSTETQRTKIKILNQTIYDCKTFQNSSKENVLILPTGDGMLIGFKNGLEQPFTLAMEFHEKLAKYNQSATGVEKIETRIGCHIGHVFVVSDVYGNTNLWGPGAILARRVMDMGDANHILVSNDLANDLIEISKDYETSLHPLHNFGIKHGDNLLIYSAFGEGFGNPVLPKEKIKVSNQVLDAEKNSKCEKIIFNIILKDKLNSAHFERYLYFSNNSSEPIYEIVAGIVTNSEEEFQTLDLKGFDENNKELEISKILAATPFSKKIVLKLHKPVFSGDSGRMVKLVYEAKLSKNNFENFFLIDTSNFELNFSHYSNVNFNPMLYYIDNKNGSKTMIEQSSKTTKGLSTNIKWEKTQGINYKDMIRLEW
ncbi:MAG: adenylate/guanylate cyclase domain-containing protein [Nitrosopumilaceae archaeon]